MVSSEWLVNILREKKEEEEKTGNEIWIALPTNAENKI